MWCCKDPTENQSEDRDKDDEEVITVIDEKEVKEWTITLRENIICLDVKLKKQKIEAFEQSETERRLAREREIDKREKDLFLQQQLLEATRLELEQARTQEKEIMDREHDLALQRQALDEQEIELDERNAVLEIVFRINENEQKISLPLRNLENVQPQQEVSDRMLARELELEEKEQELFLRQRDIEEREFEIDDKNAVLVRVNDFRKVSIQILSNDV